MAAPTKVARLERELKAVTEDRDEFRTIAKSANEEIQRITKVKNEVIESQSKQINEHRTNLSSLSNNLQNVRNELSAAKAEVSNLQRLNAIQAGYIQRANEEEDYQASAYKGFSLPRRGPKLDHSAYDYQLAAERRRGRG